MWSALGDRHRALHHWRESYRFDSTNDAVAIKLEANGVDLDTIQNVPPAPEPSFDDSDATPGADPTRTPELSVSTPALEAPPLTGERLHEGNVPDTPGADY